MLARRGLADTELLGDEEPADTILDEVAVHLRRKMRPGSLSQFMISSRRSLARALTRRASITGPICQLATLVSTLDG